MQPCEQMHDYMFIIYGSNVFGFIFCESLHFFNTESITSVVWFCFFFWFINVSVQEVKKKENPKWNETSLRH